MIDFRRQGDEKGRRWTWFFIVGALGPYTGGWIPAARGQLNAANSVLEQFAELTDAVNKAFCP